MVIHRRPFCVYRARGKVGTGLNRSLPEAPYVPQNPSDTHPPIRHSGERRDPRLRRTRRYVLPCPCSRPWVLASAGLTEGVMNGEARLKGTRTRVDNDGPGPITTPSVPRCALRSVISANAGNPRLRRTWRYRAAKTWSATMGPGVRRDDGGGKRGESGGRMPDEARRANDLSPKQYRARTPRTPRTLQPPISKRPPFHPTQTNP